jgi:hypothetical protein
VPQAVVLDGTDFAARDRHAGRLPHSQLWDPQGSSRVSDREPGPIPAIAIGAIACGIDRPNQASGAAGDGARPGDEHRRVELDHDRSTRAAMVRGETSAPAAADGAQLH